MNVKMILSEFSKGCIKMDGQFISRFGFDWKFFYREGG